VVHTWDLRTRRCVSREVDEGSFASTSLAVSADGRLYATGAKSGVVNLYDRSRRWGDCLYSMH
jgi:U3 small nucleolar RNA-associated protein 18